MATGHELSATFASRFGHRASLSRALALKVVGFLFVPLLALMLSDKPLRAQSATAEEGRAFASVGVAWDVQPANCTGCPSNARAAGPAVEAVVGVKLGQGLAIGIAGRMFQQFSFEYNQSSKYVLLIGQYSLPALQSLTLNAGAGHARHEAERSTAAARYSENGIAVSGGVSLRIPARSRIGLTTNLGLIKTVSGPRAFRPWTATFGVGLRATIG